MSHDVAVRVSETATVISRRRETGDFLPKLHRMAIGGLRRSISEGTHVVVCRSGISPGGFHQSLPEHI